MIKYMSLLFIKIIGTCGGSNNSFSDHYHGCAGVSGSGIDGGVDCVVQ